MRSIGLISSRQSLGLSDLRFTLFIDADEIRRELFDLKQRFKSISTGSKGVADDPDQQLRDKDLEFVEKEIEGLYHQLGLKGMSMSDLEARRDRLMQILTILPPNTPEYIDYFRDLKDLILELRVRRLRFLEIMSLWKRK